MSDKTQKCIDTFYQSNLNNIKEDEIDDILNQYIDEIKYTKELDDVLNEKYKELKINSIDKNISDEDLNSKYLKFKKENIISQKKISDDEFIKKYEKIKNDSKDVNINIPNKKNVMKEESENDYSSEKDVESEDSFTSSSSSTTSN
jgi:hypothetical protein